MKTTIEISDAVLNEVRKLSAREGVTLRALVEEGLRLALKARATTRTKKPPPTFPVFDGESGLTDEYQRKGLTQAIYDSYEERMAKNLRGGSDDCS